MAYPARPLLIPRTTLDGSAVLLDTLFLSSNFKCTDCPEGADHFTISSLQVLASPYNDNTNLHRMSIRESCFFYILFQKSKTCDSAAINIFVVLRKHVTNILVSSSFPSRLCFNPASLICFPTTALLLLFPLLLLLQTLLSVKPTPLLFRPRINFLLLFLQPAAFSRGRLRGFRTYQRLCLTLLVVR
jgi:hypothetical protein